MENRSFDYLYKITGLGVENICNYLEINPCLETSLDKEARRKLKFLSRATRTLKKKGTLKKDMPLVLKYLKMQGQTIGDLILSGEPYNRINSLLLSEISRSTNHLSKDEAFLYKLKNIERHIKSNKKKYEEQIARITNKSTFLERRRELLLKKCPHPRIKQKCHLVESFGYEYTP